MDQIVHYFFDFSLMKTYWPEILWGFLVTVEMSILTVAIGIPLGLAIAIVVRGSGAASLDRLLYILQ